MDLWVGTRRIGPGEPMYIIAEVGLAHDGSLALAHAYSDAVAKAGVDACKFQCHTGDPTDRWRVKPDWPTDATRQDYWLRTSFSKAQWQELARHCSTVGLEFLCSCFSLEAFKVIDPLVRMHKVPSGQVTNLPLLRAIAHTGKPVLLSSGLGTTNELFDALQLFDRALLLQCTTAYPCPPELINLPWAGSRGGLSDHSGTIWPGIAAAALRCQVLEVHVTFCRQFGPDANASLLLPDQLDQLVEGVRFVERAMRPAVRDAAGLAEARQVFMGVSA